MTKSTALIDKTPTPTTATLALQSAKTANAIDKIQDRNLNSQIENNCIAPKKTLIVSVNCHVRGRRKPLQ